MALRIDLVLHLQVFFLELLVHLLIAQRLCLLLPLRKHPQSPVLQLLSACWQTVEEIIWQLHLHIGHELLLTRWRHI